MYVVLSAFGSTGDIEPFFALALELTKQGHRAVLALPPQMALRAERLGIEFEPIGPSDMLIGVHNMIAGEIAEGISDAEKLNAYFSTSSMIKIFMDLQRVCASAEALICLAEWPLGRIIHELTGIPYVSVHLTYYNEVFAEPSLEIVEAIDQELARFMNPMRRQLGLPSLYHMVTTDGISDQLALFASSRLILDPAKETFWPSHYHITGFFFLDDQEWEPDIELVKFLEGGERPIFVTFGSMIYEESSRLLDILLEMIDRVGCRAILQAGWSGLGQDKKLPPHIFVSEFVPYSWLFPRVSCVVQSGGAGTTAWALRSGIPTVCLPHVFRQFSFARFAEYYHCGVVFPFQDLTVDLLTEAVVAILNSSDYKEAAHSISKFMQAEGGVITARKIIEKWYASYIQA